MNSIIKLTDVSVIKNGQYILKEINWDVKRDENWAIIGQNGAGKSFLLNLLSANLHPSSGKVEILNQKIGEIDIRELKKVIGFVSPNFQRDYDYGSKVKYVIYSGFFSSNGLYYDPTEEMIYQGEIIMQYLGIEKLKERIYGTLSNGEQKKVLIGRALVSNPKLLVFDEVCSGLDLYSREMLLDTIESVTQSKCNIIFVTHHIDEIVPSINKVLFIKDGEVLQTGDKKELITEKNLNEALGIRLKIVKKNKRYFAYPQK